MESILSLKDVSFKYGEKNVIHDLNFELKKGEMVCILGANGCGKTTLLRCVIGTLRVRTGEVRLYGKHTRLLSPTEVAKKMGIVFQEHNAHFPYSVLEVVRMGRAPHLGLFARPSRTDTLIAEDALDMVGMSHLKHKPYTQISGGERQMVLIARTLAQQPDIILLDEPTSHLDLKNQARVLGIIKKMSDAGISIVMSSHIPNHALLLSCKVVLMNEGTFSVSGAPEKVITEENLLKTYGVKIRVIEINFENEGGIIRLCIPSVQN